MNLSYLIPLLVTNANETTGSVIAETSEELASELIGRNLAMEVSAFFKIPYWASEILISAAIIILFWFLYRAFRYYAVKIVLKLTAKTKSTMDDKIVNQLSKPVSYVILTFGFYFALTRLSIIDTFQEIFNKAYIATLTVIAVLVVSRIIRILLEWYSETIAERTQSPIDNQFLPTLRKVINIVIWIVGFLLVLDQMGYEITTLIAGLGIGGLAVALALQDTLNNFFSGFYMMVDKPVRVGDYIKLDINEEGFIEQIGWRTTRIRTYANNIVVIPNAKLAQSVITNYFLPLQQTRVYVECGVGYDSDLDQVEKISLEVAREVIPRVEGAEKEFEPLVRFKTFGDSNVNFVVILSVNDFLARGVLQNEYMKALFHRFKKENIEIAFPKRSVYLEKIPAEFFPSSQK